MGEVSFHGYKFRWREGEVLVRLWGEEMKSCGCVGERESCTRKLERERNGWMK